MNDQPPSAISPQKSGLGLVREWVGVLVVALVIAVTVRTFVLQQFYISGPSMESTMVQNDRVLVNKLSYRLHDIHRGDVVVFDRVTVDGESVVHDDLIKRVIGLPGEVLSINNCQIFIDGQLLSEPYLVSRATTNLETTDDCRVTVMDPVTVPAGSIFVMGDNRPESFDSRMFGPIDVDLVVGRAFVIIWPLNSATLL